MKNLKTNIILTLLIWVFLYLLGSFIAWDFNPGNWDIFGRYVIGLMKVIAAIVVFGLNSKK